MGNNTFHNFNLPRMPCKLLNHGVGLHHAILIQKLHTTVLDQCTLCGWYMLHLSPPSWTVRQKRDYVHAVTTDQ